MMATEHHPLSVLIQQLDPRAVIPQYARPGDAGADLAILEEVCLEAGEIQPVRTGIAIALPPGYVGLVHPRSGLASKRGITIINTPGTIDSGYRGEIKALLVNHSPQAQRLEAGTRVAQLVIQQVEAAVFHVVSDLPESARGADGFGSTGETTRELYSHVLDRQGGESL